MPGSLRPEQPFCQRETADGEVNQLDEAGQNALCFSMHFLGRQTPILTPAQGYPLMNLVKLLSPALVALVLVSSSGAAPASRPGPARQNKPEIPDVPRTDVIAFAYYTVNQGVLKLTAQLYPLRDGESRNAVLEIQEGTVWKPMATTRVTEEEYQNYRRDKTWTAHFRVENWDETRKVPYRVVALNGVAVYEGLIRANPVGKRELVVAAFTGNSNQDRRLKPDLIANLKAQDPDLLFFSGDQSYDHVDHLGAWLLFGRQFGEIIRDRPMISIPDDHDIGQGNLWGAGGKISTNAAGDDGGYFMPVAYVKAVERAQTWHLPDPVDPSPIERGIGVYFTELHWGGVSFAILEDRKFKTGPNGPLQLKPRFSPRPDWVTNANYNPRDLDVPGLQLLGKRQEKFLKRWGEDWTGADFKAVLSQTIFSYATHISHGNRLLADLDSNGWPQSGRRRALELMRRCFAFHICGDQHLGCVAQYGLDDWGDSSLAFCVPSIVNYYPRQWLPLQPAHRPIKGPLPNLGDYVEGLGNKLTMFAYANPKVFPAPLTNLAASASGYGLVRFDKETRKITVECWPRGADVTRPGEKQYTGWPLTFDQEDSYGRKAAAWLPRLRCNVSNPVLQVVDETNNEIVYTLRIRGMEFSPKVFHPGTYKLRVGEGAALKEYKGVRASLEKDASVMELKL
jgi:hypothetical protein